MRFVVNDIDTPIFEKVVGDIKDFDSSVDFKSFEEAYVKEHNPFYVLVKIPSTDLQSVHILEDNGFKFSEMQYILKFKPKKSLLPIDGFDYSEVVNYHDLDAVIEIATSIFNSDRIFLDKELSKYYINSVASARYKKYLEISYHSSSQKIIKVFNIKTGEIVAFHSFALAELNRARTLLGGVKFNAQKSFLNVVSWICRDNALYDNGVLLAEGGASASNLESINLELCYFRRKVSTSLVVLRKIYPNHCTSSTGGVQLGKSVFICYITIGTHSYSFYKSIALYKKHSTSRLSTIQYLVFISTYNICADSL